MTDLLTIATRWTGRRYVVTAAGEIDLSTCPVLAEALRGCGEQPLDELEVDLSDVTFVDSTGFACLVQWAEDCRAQGIAFSVRRQANVQRVMDLMGWDIPEPAGSIARGHSRLTS
jgi:anti-sigma B factor antagonist